MMSVGYVMSPPPQPLGWLPVPVPSGPNVRMGWPVWSNSTTSACSWSATQYSGQLVAWFPLPQADVSFRATVVVEAGVVRYVFRFAAVVGQVSDAWMGTVVSVTLIDHTWEIVPALSTWPVSVSVTVEAAALDTDSRAIISPRTGARRRHAG